MAFHPVEIREYRPADAEVLPGLFRAAIQSVYPGLETDSWTSDLSNVEESYLENGGCFLVGVDKISNPRQEETVAIGALMNVGNRVVEMKRLAVLPGLQGHKVGRKMADELEHAAFRRGYREVQLDTTHDQVAARNLYQSMGYKLVDRRDVDHPSGNTFDTYFYHKYIRPTMPMAEEGKEWDIPDSFLLFPLDWRRTLPFRDLGKDSLKLADEIVANKAADDLLPLYATINFEDGKPEVRFAVVDAISTGHKMLGLCEVNADGTYDRYKVGGYSISSTAHDVYRPAEAIIRIGFFNLAPEADSTDRT